MKHNIYEFNPDDAREFARAQRIQVREKGDELHFLKCPYCGNRTNDKNTFAINLKTGQFKCLRSTCRASGNMLTLAKDFDFSLGTEVDEYYKPKKQFREFTQPKAPIVPKPPAVQYLQSRGISEEVAKKYEITTQTGKDNVLVFPFYDEKGQMVFVKYRKTDFDKTKDKGCKEWCESEGKPILFGMKQCTGHGTLIVTEGQLDSLSVATAGIENAVSVPTGARGFTWVPYCWDFVNQYDKIIIFGDHEKGKITLLDDFRTRFKKPIFHVREEDYKDCKDANDILRAYGKEYVRHCIDNAIQLKVNYLVDVADIEDVNLYEIEKLRTGIKVLDFPLYGGLPFPGLVVVTGKRGEGKSTLGSQIIAEAAKQNIKSMVYSGELSAYQFKAGLMRQIAGGNHTYKYQTKLGYEGYEISKANKALITAWMKGKILLFDNTTIDQNVGLIEAIETAIRQEGVRVVLLDNLMTALSLEGGSDDKLERQSALTQKLAHMAMQYNIIIILVAHKRKNATSDEMDDISGSSDITNLATVAISYSRDNELAESQRKLKLLKNRIYGGLGSWTVDFDERSNRIYGEGDNVNREYGWETNNFENAVPEEIPF